MGQCREEYRLQQLFLIFSGVKVKQPKLVGEESINITEEGDLFGCLIECIRNWNLELKTEEIIFRRQMSDYNIDAFLREELSIFMGTSWFPYLDIKVVAKLWFDCTHDKCRIVQEQITDHQITASGAEKSIACWPDMSV